jgi:hypothetical protein
MATQQQTLQPSKNNHSLAGYEAGMDNFSELPRILNHTYIERCTRHPDQVDQDAYHPIE